MERDITTKIKSIVAKEESIDEDTIRSLMILVRKMLEQMPQSDQNLYLRLILFCNWVAHNKITQSNTGLRILAEINDTLTDIKNLTDTIEMRTRMSNAIGFPILRKEMKLFFGNIRVADTLISNNNLWGVFISNLIETIRDVPLSFPSLSNLDKTKQKIYNQIAKNPIKIGAGVIFAKISLIKYPPPTDEIMCLAVKTEDTTTVVVPLLVDVRL